MLYEEDYDLSCNNSYDEIDFINTIWIVKSPSYIVIQISIFLPVLVLGIFGNTLVIYIIATNRFIRTPTNLLIGNMASADLLFLLINPWLILTYDFFQNYEMGSVGCKGEAALECCILIASVISMSVVTYDRLTAIVLPKEKRVTYTCSKYAILAAWLTGIAIGTPLILYRHYKERQWKNFLEKYCNEDAVIINIYWYVVITVIVWIPLLIQTICYVSIFIKLHKYEKLVLEKLNYREISYKAKAARMMAIVTLTFMVCRLPFTSLIIYRHNLLTQAQLNSTQNVVNAVNGQYHTLWFTSKFLIYTNAALNPLIYSMTNTKFRKAFRMTKLSKWLFPPPTKKPVEVGKEKRKVSMDEVRKKLFGVRWRNNNEKMKVIPYSISTIPVVDNTR